MRLTALLVMRSSIWLAFGSAWVSDLNMKLIGDILKLVFYSPEAARR